MEILQAIILGIVEGLTEFLPISSTGHLIVAQNMLGFYDMSKMFTVVIQIGAIAAVIWFYRLQLLQLTKGLLRGDKLVRRFWKLWVLATIPAGLTGLLLEAKIEHVATTWVVAVALIIGGIAIWGIETYRHIPKSTTEPQFQKLTLKQALLIGAYQILALVPGVSRSGATIMGGMLSGVDRVTATAFSFYLGIPILLIAGIYKLITGDTAEVSGGGSALFVGIISAFITALLVVTWLLKYVSRHNFKVFAYYRIVFGAFLLILLITGVLG